MIDPVHSLAFSIQANRGVYAILVGSGVSRAAKIPTGWEVVLDLIRKLAILCGETCDPEPELWYREKLGREADYSSLLDELAKTPAERQQLLREYWEPNDQERKEGEKQPTAAHRAIAALAARGFIRVILTTNFDRLVETALTDAGVVPTILSSPDQVQGALPLIHTQCCVVKVHGDYLDTRIKNTPAELDSYSPEFDQFLDRIFDDFGLIVCGWSAEWDGALRKAIFRAPSRRFSTYWAARGDPVDQAQRLINHRRAQVIRIEDADSFLPTVQQYVESIDQLSRPHPLSTEAAVASLKRYLPEPRHRIQLSDLITKTVELVAEQTSGEAFAVEGSPTPTTEAVTARVRQYEATCSTLTVMATVGGFWAEKEHYPVWQRALQRLGSTTSRNGSGLWLELQRYPATLLLYALGLGAVAADRFPFLGHIFATTLRNASSEDVPAVKTLPPSCLFSDSRLAQILEGMEKRRVPLNDWIHDALRPYSEHIIPDSAQYTLFFDKLEILMALSYLGYEHREAGWSRERDYWAPAGAFAYRSPNREQVLQEIEESVSTQEFRSPFVASAVFGQTPEQCQEVLTAFEELLWELKY